MEDDYVRFGSRRSERASELFRRNSLSVADRYGRRPPAVPVHQPLPASPLTSTPQHGPSQLGYARPAPFYTEGDVSQVMNTSTGSTPVPNRFLPTASFMRPQANSVLNSTPKPGAGAVGFDFEAEMRQNTTRNSENLLPSPTVAKSPSPIKQSVFFTGLTARKRPLHSAAGEQSSFKEPFPPKLAGSSAAVNTSLGSARQDGPPLKLFREKEVKIRRTESHKPEAASTPIVDPKTLWVTVFGFNLAEDKDAVLELFGRHGTVIEHTVPQTGNWMALRYSTPTHVAQAVQRHGQFIGNNLIGVINRKVVPPLNRTSSDAKDKTTGFFGLKFW